MYKFVQRSYIGEKVLFLISFIGVPFVVYLKYLLRFVIHLIGEENNSLLILRISKKTCGIPNNYY